MNYSGANPRWAWPNQASPTERAQWKVKDERSVRSEAVASTLLSHFEEGNLSRNERWPLEVQDLSSTDARNYILSVTSDSGRNSEPQMRLKRQLTSWVQPSETEPETCRSLARTPALQKLWDDKFVLLQGSKLVMIHCSMIET